MEPVDPLLAALARLAPPVSNAYFHGQLLGVANFRREQEYHKLRDWRQNLHATGGGILTGLEVNAGLAADGRFTVTVAPGIAVDLLGRDIVVPHPDRNAGVGAAAYPLDPHDPKLKALKPADAEVEVEVDLDVYVEYVAEAIDFAPVRAGDCDALRQYAPGATRETYAVTFEFARRPAVPGPTPPQDAAREAIFPAEPAAGYDPLPKLREAYHEPVKDWTHEELKAPPRVFLDRVRLRCAPRMAFRCWTRNTSRRGGGGAKC